VSTLINCSIADRWKKYSKTRFKFIEKKKTKRRGTKWRRRERNSFLARERWTYYSFFLMKWILPFNCKGYRQCKNAEDWQKIRRKFLLLDLSTIEPIEWVARARAPCYDAVQQHPSHPLRHQSEKNKLVPLKPRKAQQLSEATVVSISSSNITSCMCWLWNTTPSRVTIRLPNQETFLFDLLTINLSEAATLKPRQAQRSWEAPKYPFRV